MAWGPTITSEDLLFKMQGQLFTDQLVDLLGHSMGAPDVSTIDALEVNRINLKRGKPTKEVEYVAAEQVIGQTFSIGIPPAAVYSDLKYLAERAEGVRYDLFTIYNCDSNTDYHFFTLYPQALFNAPRQTSAVLTVADDREAWQWETSALIGQSPLTNFRVAAYLQQTSASNPLHAIAFNFGDCYESPVGLTGTHVRGYYAGEELGGEGSAANPSLAATGDRFATGTQVNTTTGIQVTSLYSEGSFCLAGYVDSLATPASGGIYVTTDGGTSFSALTFPGAATPPILAITKGGGKYLAVGGDRNVWQSTDGYEWTQIAVADSIVAATCDFNDVAYDEATLTFYLVGADGTDGEVVTLRDNALNNISTDVAGLTGVKLFAVASLYPGHIALAGEGGYYKESPHLDQGSSFGQVSVGGTTDDILAIGGHRWRTLVGAGTTVYIRDLLSNMRFVSLTVKGGVTITGNITDIAVGDFSYDLDNFAFCTDDGELFIVKNASPQG